METIFIEGIEMATRMARQMKVPVFNFEDYSDITGKAHVSDELAKRLFLTVLKTTSESNSYAVVCVEDSDYGRDIAKELTESIQQKNISTTSYVFFNTRPDINSGEIIDGIEMLASMLKDQEIPFHASQAAPATTADGEQDSNVTVEATADSPVTYEPPLQNI